MAASPALATASAHALPPDRIALDRREGALELSWSDAEDRLQGALQPQVPRAGEPLRVLLHLGSFEGAAFEGPLTVTLRPQGATGGQEQLARKGERNWYAEFLPAQEGRYRLDVRFRTTRLKVLHADFEVGPRPVPRFILWGLVGAAAAAALGLGLRRLVRREEPPAL